MFALDLIGKLLKARIPSPIVIGVILALSGVLFAQQGKLLSRAHEVTVATGQLQAAAGQLDATRVSLDACHASNLLLAGQLSDQNRQIAHARTLADAAEAQAAGKIAVALRGKLAAEQTAARLTALRGDRCEDYRAAEAAVKETLQ